MPADSAFPGRLSNVELVRGMYRRDLLDVYRHALAAVSGRCRVRAALDDDPVAGPVRVVALGKAAGAMTEGAFDALGERIEEALIVTRYGHARGPDALSAVRIEAAHPVPDANSLVAGRTLLDFIARTPASATLLFLISGGASALVEAPCAGIDLEGLQRAYHWLLGSALSITVVNRIRSRLSRIKGGGLAAYLRGRRARQLLISDVPGDDPATIGSGLLSAPASGDDASIPEREIPGWLREMLAEPVLPVAGVPVETRIVATVHDACAAAAARGRALGYDTHVDGALLDGDATAAGHTLAAALRQGRPGLYVHGGETVVRLPESPGRGGRCQNLALATALGIAGDDSSFLLAAGTDGNDGTGGAAGALVDGGTIARGSCHGLDASQSLREADAGGFLDIADDLIYTGPGNTNVMDLVLGLRISTGPGRGDV